MALQKGLANLYTLMVRQPNNPLGVIFLSKILVAQISTCFGGDVYEGQWKGDKANGEGVGLQPLQPFILLQPSSFTAFHRAKVCITMPMGRGRARIAIGR